jgi:hypothetical protein
MGGIGPICSWQGDLRTATRGRFHAQLDQLAPRHAEGAEIAVSATGGKESERCMHKVSLSDRSNLAVTFDP